MGFAPFLSPNTTPGYKFRCELFWIVNSPKPKIKDIRATNRLRGCLAFGERMLLNAKVRR